MFKRFTRFSEPKSMFTEMVKTISEKFSIKLGEAKRAILIHSKI